MAAHLALVPAEAPARAGPVLQCAYQLRRGGEAATSHVLELPDEVYKQIEAYAASRGLTPAEVVREWAAANTHAESTTGEQRVGNPAFDPWAGFRGISVMTDAGGAIYHPADDPLAEFLGRGELTDADAIRHHDAVIAAEAMDPHHE